MRKFNESAYERIMKSAAKLFALKGYYGTTTRQIVADAGASLSSLQFHFQSKESLYEAVMKRTSEMFYTANADIIHEIDEVEKQGLLDKNAAWNLLVELTGCTVDWSFNEKYKYEILLVNRRLFEVGNTGGKIPDHIHGIYRYYQKLFDAYMGTEDSTWAKMLSFSIVTTLYDYANYSGVIKQIVNLDTSLEENHFTLKVYVKKYLLSSMKAGLDTFGSKEVELG